MMKFDASAEESCHIAGGREGGEVKAHRCTDNVGLLILPLLFFAGQSFNPSINIFITHIVLTEECLLFDPHLCSECLANIQNKSRRQAHRTNFADVS